jgi:predicted TIM-barrel fold metal-dependent hydrolase
MIIDGHAHIWLIDPLAYPWQPTFGFIPTEEASPDVLIEVMDRLSVDWTVLVQPSVYGADHRLLLRTVARHPDRFVAVGLIDPAEPRAADRARHLVDEEGCVGLRVNLSLDLGRARQQARPDGWVGLESMGVPVCLRATAAHHDLAKSILTRHRSLRIVIDHLELPERGRLDAAVERLAELATFDNCLLKVAGLGRFSADGPPFRDTWPLMREVLRLFGSSRLLWGSDHPAAAYPAAVEAIMSMPFIRGRAQDQVMAGTSLELWGPIGVRPT